MTGSSTVKSSVAAENDAFGSLNPFADPPWYNGINSPYYKASHRRLRGFIRAYVDDHISPNCEQWETQGFIPKEANERHAKLGFVAPGIFPPPVEYMSNIPLPAGIPAEGTSHDRVDVEWDAFHDLIFIDEMARCGYLGVNWGLSCGNAIGCPPIINYGTEEQKRYFLPPILRGEKRMCLAITEPSGSSTRSD
jgi:alkylation response protein AidB-like acyl-CoA dehydrogenase